MKFVLFEFCMILSARRAIAETYTGTISIGCTDGNCIFSGQCDSLSVPGGQQEGQEYTNINGDVRLTPSTCQADCSGCVSIVGSDQDDNACIGSAGYVWCPELDDCVQPWSTNCPFEGDSFVGPVEIECTNGRCNNLSEECAIETGSAVVGGPYLTAMEGIYLLPEGCTATCEGCTCEDCEIGTDGSTAGRILPSPLPILSMAFSAIVIILF